jgi:hypothetical protein
LQPVHFRGPCRQRFQMQSLDGEQLSRHGAKKKTRLKGSCP